MVLAAVFTLVVVIIVSEPVRLLLRARSGAHSCLG